MICTPCKNFSPKDHVSQGCLGGTWCDCQHNPNAQAIAGEIKSQPVEGVTDGYTEFSEEA